MSNSISSDRLPSAVVPTDEQLARTPARQPSDESWHRTFEHALGSSFDRWFQAPTERGDATPNGARAPSATPTLASQPAASMFAKASGARASTASARASAGTAARETTQRSAAATPTSGADATAAQAQVQAQGIETGANGLSAATQALVAALGGLAEAIPVVGVESPSQAMPSAAAAAPSRASATRTENEEDSVDADVAETPASTAPHDAAAADEREPLRVHAEWSDAGVRVWLGADANGLAEIDSVTRQLQQWLGSQGTRLLGVVCNGKQVWTPERDGATATPGSNAADAAASTDHDLAATSVARGFPYQPISL